MVETTEPTAEEMAEYVREHRCHNARRDVTLGDWGRGIRRIEADAILRSTSRDSEVREAIEALPEDHCYGCQHENPRAVSKVSRDAVLAILDRSSEAAPTPPLNNFSGVIHRAWASEAASTDLTDIPTANMMGEQYRAWMAAGRPAKGPIIPASEAAPTLHPDDGHEHSWGCRRCGVDPAPVSEAAPTEGFGALGEERDGPFAAAPTIRVCFDGTHIEGCAHAFWPLVSPGASPTSRNSEVRGAIEALIADYERKHAQSEIDAAEFGPKAGANGRWKARQEGAEAALAILDRPSEAAPTYDGADVQEPLT